MMNFKKSKTSKVVSGFVGLATALMMMGPAVASAVTVEELQAQINALLAQLSALQGGTGTQQTGGLACPVGGFTATLTMGSTGSEVMALQKFLNSVDGTQLATTGAGSPGNETSYFGSISRAAVSKFQEKYGISPTAGYWDPLTREKANSLCAAAPTSPTTPTTPTAPGTPGSVSAWLDASSPSASTFVAGQALGTLGAFKIMNAGTGAGKVTSIKLKRTGVSSDTTLSNVYLFVDGKRVTDAASVATGVVSFNDSTGIVTVAPGNSVVVTVRSDIAASTNGQTVSVMLTDVTVDGAMATGLPVSSAVHTIASAPSDLMTANFTTAAATPAAASIDPQLDYTLWQESLAISSHDARLGSIRLRQLGSINVGDVKNFRFLVDGVQVGVTEAVDSNGYVTFVFATPVTVKTGTHVLKLVGDITGGSNRTAQFSLRQASDVDLSDSQLGVGVLPTANSSAFASVDAGIQTINTGTISITKASDSPSGNVILAGSGITYAKFNVKGLGEKLKVENLRVSHTSSEALWTGIRNGALFLNGVQVGSTATINEDSQSTAYTQFSLGSSMVLEPGVNYVLEVRGDVHNTSTVAGTALVAGTTTAVNIAAGSSNVLRMVTGSYIANTAATGNTLTIAAGTLTASKYTAYANQTVTVPQTAYKLGEFRVTSGSSETVNVDTVTVQVLGDTAGTASVTAGDITNLYFVYGSKTSSVKATAAATQSWSINETVAPNTTLNVAVYGTLISAMDGIASTTLVVSGTSQSAGTAVTSGSAVAGQNITVASGTFTTAVDASTPVIANVVGGSMPKVASFKFTTLYDTFTLKDIGVTVGGPDNASAIVEVVFKDGATELRRASFNGNIATGTDLNVAVAPNSTKVIDVYASLGGVGVGFATTSQNVALTMDCVKYSNSSGTISSDCTDRAGNATWVFKTKPTITNAALPTTALPSSGTVTIGKVTIAADSAGTIAWRRLVWNFTTSSPSGSFVLSAPVLYDSADESTSLAGVTVTLNGGLAGSGNITASSSAAAAEKTIGAGTSKTYVLKATISGTPVSGSSISTSLAASSTSRTAPEASTAVSVRWPSFLWSDLSALSHTDLTADWMDDYQVKSIPTDTQTVSKS